VGLASHFGEFYDGQPELDEVIHSRIYRWSLGAKSLGSRTRSMDVSLRTTLLTLLTPTSILRVVSPVLLSSVVWSAGE